MLSHDERQNAHLHCYMEFGGAFRGTRCFKGLAVNFHRHGEDRHMDRPSLRNELILEPRLQLVQPHQSIHGLGRLGFFIRSCKMVANISFILMQHKPKGATSLNYNKITFLLKFLLLLVRALVFTTLLFLNGPFQGGGIGCAWRNLNYKDRKMYSKSMSQRPKQ